MILIKAKDIKDLKYQLLGIFRKPIEPTYHE